jgi:hypothetical protein
MARPKLNIDPHLVEELAGLGCKNKEIAVLLGCSTDTLERNFAAEMEKGRENLKMSLRRWQLESAKKGNVVMLIWLGKQMLGQTDRVETLNTVQVKPLEPKEVLTILREDPFLNGNDPRVGEITDAELTDRKTGEDLPETGS